MGCCLSASAEDVIGVLIAKPDIRAINACGDGFEIHLRTHSNGSISINGRPIALKSFKSQLDEIYSTRAERVVYFESDADVPFASVASVLAVCKSIPNLHVVLVTDKIRSAPCLTFQVPR